MTDFINESLNARLIDVGDNDNRLEQMRDAGESLADQFIEQRTLLVRFLRFALVKSVDPKSKVLEDIEDLLEEDWPTFASYEPERQIPILMAVGWQAVLQAVAKDNELSAVVWYGSVNLLNQDSIDPMSSHAIDFVKQQGEIVEKEACSHWDSFVNVAGKQVKVIEAPNVQTEIAVLLQKAVSNVEKDNATPLEGGNPNAVSVIGPWAQHFATHAAGTINTSMKNYGDSIIKAIQVSFNDLNKKFGSLKKELTRSHQAQSRRTELLWLAESQYSPRLKKGYREISSKEAIIMLAYDVAEIANGNSPQCVEYFLSETVKKILDGKLIKVETFVKELAKSNVLDSISDVMFEPLDGVQRLGLFEFIGIMRANNSKLSDFVDRTGFEKSDSKSPAELARWLYREIKCVESTGGEIWK